jgi:hypothetical protein
MMGAAIWWLGVWWPGGMPVAGETITQALNGATRADITIGLGAGTLRLHGLDDSADLIHGAVIRAPRDQLTRNFALSDGTACFVLQNRSRSGLFIPFGNQPADQIVWDLRLNLNRPTKRALDAGDSAPFQVFSYAVSFFCLDGVPPLQCSNANRWAVVFPKCTVIFCKTKMGFVTWFSSQATFPKF